MLVTVLMKFRAGERCVRRAIRREAVPPFTSAINHTIASTPSVKPNLTFYVALNVTGHSQMSLSGSGIQPQFIDAFGIGISRVVTARRRQCERTSDFMQRRVRASAAAALRTMQVLRDRCAGFPKRMFGVGRP